MENRIDELRDMAMALLAPESDSRDVAARKKWGDKVRDLLRELTVYNFELEHQNAALERSQYELSESRAKYFELFENAPVGYVVIDRNADINQANRTFSDMFIPAYSREGAAKGRNFRDLVCPEFRDVFTRFVKKLPDSAPIIPVEMKIFDFNEKPRYVTITAGVRNPGDRLFRLTVSDINSRKKLEMQLMAEREQTEKTDCEKMLFLTRVNHELRTPLSSLSGLCSMLSDSKSTPEMHRNYLEFIDSTLDSMRVVSNEIADLSMLDSGLEPLQPVPVDVLNICRKHVEIVRSLMREKGVQVICEIFEMPVLICDPVRLETVIHSILRYAAENVSKGGIRICGRYEETPDGSGMFYLEISGRGIGSEHHADATIFSKYDCAGIELFLARRVLKFMNGHLACAPSGDSIQIEIPLLRASASAVVGPESGTLSGDGPKSCLIVDDVPLNLKVLAAMMRKCGCVSVTAASGEDALRSLSRNRVDLILTDLWMPEMNGMEFAMSVRQIPAYSDIPIVAVTADVERMENFDMRYFADTLIKPVKLENLKNTMHALWNNGLDCKK